MSEFKNLKADDKIKIAHQIQATEAMIYFKFSDTEVFKAKAMPSGSQKMISCKRPPDLNLGLTNKRVTLNFVLNQEIYFMNTIINIGPREIHFSLDVELLHLVRRKNRRLKIPADYDASVVIKRMDGQMTFLKASVLDISNEGCRLGLNTLDPMVPSEGKIEGTLRLPTKQSVELQGEVRYHKTHPRSENKQVFGIQFGGMSPYTTSRVKGLILELQRELFLRVLE